MISHKFINHILHVTLTKDTSLDEFLDFKMQIDNLPASLKILYDIGESHLNIQLDDIPTISKRAKELLANFDRVKTAFVVNNPKATTYTMLYSWLDKSDRISREVFQTKEEALNWLNNDSPE